MMKEQNMTDRVKTDCKKKIDTTMIGALCAIEEIFGYLWNHKSLTKTKEEAELYNKYEELRSRILDNGNNQKRKLDDDLSNYDVTPKKFHYNFRVINESEK